MSAFVGDILQTPPRFSAKKLAGRPVYKMARAGEEFSLAPSPVTVFRFDLRDFRAPFVDFEAACSSGTYIRSLAHDLGAKLGCGAHLASLRRTSVGPYGLADAVALADLEEAADRGEAGRHIVPLERPPSRGAGHHRASRGRDPGPERLPSRGRPSGGPASRAPRRARRRAHSSGCSRAPERSWPWPALPPTAAASIRSWSLFILEF